MFASTWRILGNAKNNTSHSSVGRAEDCKLYSLSLGRVFESLWEERDNGIMAITFAFQAKYQGSIPCCRIYASMAKLVKAPHL